MDEELATAAIERAAGRFPSEQLPELAVRALTRGTDSEALRELAGLPSSDVRDAADLFLTALDELGIPTPSRRDALHTLARRTAGQIVVGNISPIAGAAQLEEIHDAPDGPEDLAPFSWLIVLWDDQPRARASLNIDIVEAAASWLQSHDTAAGTRDR